MGPMAAVAAAAILPSELVAQVALVAQPSLGMARRRHPATVAAAAAAAKAQRLATVALVLVA